MIFRSFLARIKPHAYYNDDNVCIGSYVQNKYDIRFTPIEGTSVNGAVHASIDISNQYKMPVKMVFNNVEIDIPYPTSSDNATIQNITDEYRRQFEIMVKSRTYTRGARVKS